VTHKIIIKFLGTKAL